MNATYRRPAAGLYDPAFEHDACGVAFVADLAGRRDHGIVQKALTALRNLEHRGARGGEPDTGDGAGILVQVPDAFFRAGRRLRAARNRVGTRSAPPSCPRPTLADGRRDGRDRGHRRAGGPARSWAGGSCRCNPMASARRPAR